MKFSARSLVLGSLLVAACSPVPPSVHRGSPLTPSAALVPAVDHHAHLLSERGAARISETPQPRISLPQPLEILLARRAEGWNQRAVLAGIYAEDAVVADPARRAWLTGREAAAEHMAERLFARGYHMVPIHHSGDATSARVIGYYARGEGAAERPFGQFLLTLRRDAAGAWVITTETATFPGPTIYDPQTAEQRIAQMDEAGMEQAVVHSVAYWFGSPLWPRIEDEEAVVRAENDWTAEQASRFPGRLVAFCSVNPLREYALAEIRRCAAHPGMRGLKLHFGNSRADVRDAATVEALRGVFRAANAGGLAIAAHLWDGPEYGREHARIFLEELLPAAPDVTVQIAHFAGGGPGYTDAALEVFAEAIEAGDPRTRNLFFDIATVADGVSGAGRELLARRIRQVGPERVLFGVDLGPPAPRQSWLIFRTTVPLTEAEFAVIAANRAPYLR